MLRKSRLFVLPFLMLPILSTTVSCGNDNKLLILNWGEYINDDIVAKFEEEYDCEVSISIADSNELFYSKIKAGTTAYDLVVPSEYMVKKMKEQDLLEKLDLSRIESFSQEDYLPGVQGIENEMVNNYGFEEFKEYQIPYFWGTFGIMYSKTKPGVEEAIKENGWNALFDKSLLPSGSTTGMYNVPRFAYAASLFHLGYENPNVVGDEYLSQVKSDYLKANFNQWGTDDLKKKVAKGDLDAAYVYTGDYLDMYYQESSSDVNYDIYIPSNTIAFMDSFVMPKKARHKDLAYEFINYFTKPENAYENASIIGYCTTRKTTYNMILESGDKNWANSIEKCYPLPDETWTKSYQGVPLDTMDKNYLTKISNTINDVKVG